MNRQKDKRMDAMIIVDMQRGLIDAHPPREETVVANIKELAYICRLYQIPVIYIRHDGGKGDLLERNTQAWEIARRIYPQFGEKVFDKCYNSAFKETGLQAHLESLGARKLIICGMQSEYCIDATIKVAFEFGYEVIVPKGMVMTFDNAFCDALSLSEYYEEQIWNHRYAHVLPMKQVIMDIQKYNKEDPIHPHIVGS